MEDPNRAARRSSLNYCDEEGAARKSIHPGDPVLLPLARIAVADLAVVVKFCFHLDKFQMSTSPCH